MAKHNFTGKLGELLAIQLLKLKGYQILDTNWRYRKAEIDIIAIKQEILVFVEVKSRTSSTWGHPADFFTEAQEERIMGAAGFYLEEKQYEGEIRFDLITVVLPNNDVLIEHFEDAFY